MPKSAVDQHIWIICLYSRALKTKNVGQNLKKIENKEKALAQVVSVLAKKTTSCGFTIWQILMDTQNWLVRPVCCTEDRAMRPAITPTGPQTSIQNYPSNTDEWIQQGQLSRIQDNTRAIPSVKTQSYDTIATSLKYLAYSGRISGSLKFDL